MRNSDIAVPTERTTLTTFTIAFFTSWFAYQSYRRLKYISLSQSSSTNSGVENSEDNDDHTDDYESLIGNTPLIKLKKLSSMIGDGTSSIYVKMECMNPGGTGKDRAALFMLRDAEKRGDLPPPLTHHRGCGRSAPSSSSSSSSLHSADGSEDQSRQTADISEISNDKGIPKSSSLDCTKLAQSAIAQTRTGGIVVEGTSGSTGISLATLCAQRGHSIIIVMPDDQAQEKRAILKCLGAFVHVVPNASISNPAHYVNVARRIALDINKGIYDDNTVGTNDREKVGRRRLAIKAVFINQFENESNYRAHYTSTGPELWKQSSRRRDHRCIDAFCMSSGTGGTISGVGRYLKERTGGRCKIVLVDPPGSALYNKVKYNVAYASEQKERAMLRHRYDTIAEGIGLDRITHNFALGVEKSDGASAGRAIADAVRVEDQEAVDMAHWLLQEEGLFVGSSSAMNVVGAVRVAQNMMAPGSCIVTVICDGGQRHLTRFWNRDFVTQWGLEWPGDCISSWRKRLPF